MTQRKTSELSFGIVLLFGLIACVLYGVGAGVRADIGILLNPLADHCGLHYEDVSFCIAVMQIVFGATQPIFGIIAGRRSNRQVLILGALLLMASMIGMLLSRSFFSLLFFLGFVFGAGAGALAFGLILTSAIHFVGQQHAMTIAGMLNAAAGMIGFILSPLMQAVLSAGGLFHTLMMLCGIAAALIPAALIVTRKDPPPKAEQKELPPVGELFVHAFRNRTYRLLLAGFSTCGFHMVIIESHLFSQYVSYGIAKNAASWAFSVYGIATILGALLSGYLSKRVRKGNLLGFYYGFRAVWVLVYLFLLPKNLFTAVLFAVGLGMTDDATVSPTSGLVNENFPLVQVASLIGLLFLVHQIGAFCSAWLGGLLLEATGGYNAVWLIDIALCIMASLFSLRIHRGAQRSAAA